MNKSNDNETKLHPAARRMFEFIVRFKTMQGGDSPTRREMASALGLQASGESVQRHLEELVNAGLVQIERGQARRIRVSGGRWEHDLSEHMR